MASGDEDTQVFHDENLRLRAELAEIKQKVQSLQSELDTTKKPPCLFTQKFPVELRNKIYRLLLVNQLLSTGESIHRPRSHNEPCGFETYGLHPNILRTCRQVNHEASDILYGSNTFLIDCIDKSSVKSPLFRLQNPYGISFTGASGSCLSKHPAVNKVKHWKVLVGGSKHEFEQSPTHSFVYFCREICNAQPSSLTIAIVPRGKAYLRRWDGIYTSSLHPEYHEMEAVLSPLFMLRNIGTLSFTTANTRDLLTFESPNTNDVQPHDIPRELISALTDLVQSKTPMTHIFKMYNNLLAYAQTFERNALFREEMRSVHGHASNPSYDLFGNLQNDHRSPFKHSNCHPVETALAEASTASDYSSLVDFKAARRTVLTYLEPQFQRISNACMTMNQMVKRQKCPDGLFSVEREGGSSSSGTSKFKAALGLLEEYAKAFTRDMSPEARIQISRMGIEDAFECSYARLPREAKIRQLGDVLRGFECESSSQGVFLDLFKEVVDDMDMQVFEIRRARRKIFEFDGDGDGDGDCDGDGDGDTGCDQVDVEILAAGTEKLVDWGVHEPRIGPEMENRFLGNDW